MTTLFKTPKPPKMPAPPPPPPTIDDAARLEESSAKLARRRGRIATLKGGRMAEASVGARTLLGGP